MNADVCRRTTTCPFCGGNGRVTWIGLAMLGTWLVWVAFGRALPDVWNGVLVLALPALALWAWSCAGPSYRTPWRVNRPEDDTARKASVPITSKGPDPVCIDLGHHGRERCVVCGAYPSCTDHGDEREV